MVTAYKRLLRYFTADEIIKMMPKSMDHIIQIIGIESAIELMGRFGGTQLYIPSLTNISLEQPIVTTIGLGASKVFYQHFGTTNFDIPKGQKLFNALRDKEISESNVSGNELAIIHNLTRRQIRSIISNSHRSKK